MNDILNELISLSLKSLETGDVPIGALIIKDGIIIARSYNTREKNQSVLGHAEINAIIEASKKLNNWNLCECEMYVTLKPCSMCMEVIKQSRINMVYYLLDKPVNKREYDKTNILKVEDKKIEDYYKKILNEFFRKLRNK